ncbi:MAG: SHOCT domain-containing protein [Desulfobacterales bacterium]
MIRLGIFKTTILSAVLVAISAGLPIVAAAAGTPAVKEKVELLLVQNSRDVTIDKDKGTLTLKGVSPTTLFFSDRPVRMAGHFNKEDYLKLWTDGKDSFDADPPNATLSVFEGGQDDLLDVVVKLYKPRYRGDDLIYDITLIEGQLPKAGGPSSLFIDIFGVWRRTARRAVWVGAAAATTATAAEAGAAAAAASHPTTVTVQETAAPPASSAQTMSSSQASAVARLKELKSLQQQGLITEEQYQEESQKLLNQIAE